MKKIISILLAVVLVASVAVVSVSAGQASDPEIISVKEAIAAYEAENGTTIDTFRYYFLVPDGKSGMAADRDIVDIDPDTGEETILIHKGDLAPSWINEFNLANGECCALYWWGATNAPNPEAWVGYKVERVGNTNVYYADVPNYDDYSVTTIIWNNGVDGGTSETDPGYYYRAQTVNINTEGYDRGESPRIPDGCEDFDGMIYIVDPTKTSINEYSGAATCGGEWLYYYGDECFGAVKGGEEDLAANCMNAAHHHGEEDVLVGDANNDGKISVADATRIQRFVAKICDINGGAYTPDLTDSELKRADANGDGKLSVADATRIQRYVAKICNMDGSTPYVG